VLRLYGDRSALDRELELLKRYTDKLEAQGIRVKFDVDGVQGATRDIDGFRQQLSQVAQSLRAVRDGIQGDDSVWRGISTRLAAMGEAAAASGGRLGALGSAAANLAAGGVRLLPILGQIGLAAEGLRSIFEGVTGAINGVLAPLQALAAETGRFNQQVAEAAIFTANAFAVFGPDGRIIEGTAQQMRALRGVVTDEFLQIQREVAQISGATSAEVYEGFNIILQNVAGLGEAGQKMENLSKLALRTAAAMNTLNIPGFQLRSELQSLLTGDVQMYDQLASKIYGAGAADKIRQLQSEGKYYDDLMAKLQKLYDGQKVLALSLENVKSNFADVFQTISAQAGVALERGLARMMQSVLTPLTSLQDSFTMLGRSLADAFEPVFKILGQVGSAVVSVASALASIASIAMNVAAVVLNAVGLGVLPVLEIAAKSLETIAKLVEIIAKLIDIALKPVSALFRVFGEVSVESVDNFFDVIIRQLERFNNLLDQVGKKIAGPGRAIVSWAAGLAAQVAVVSDPQTGQVRRLTAEERRDMVARAEASYDASTGTNQSVSISAMGYNPKTVALMDELTRRYGSSSQRQLQTAKEVSQIKQDTYRNEITSLENGLRLLQAQKSMQEAMNGLAEARRDMAMKQAAFLGQLAVSPEARLAAGDRQNQLAADQERERIRERVGMLGMEREMLRQQLAIQERQAAIQREGLVIQQLELRIQRDKASAAAVDVYSKIQTMQRGGVSRDNPQLLAAQETFRQLNREVDLRNSQLGVIRRQIELSDEGAKISQTINTIEERRLGLQEQTLGVQEQLVGLTLEQQQQLSALQRQEQQLQNQAAAKKKLLEEGLSPLEAELKALQQQQEAGGRLEQIEKARGELAKARVANEVKAAENALKLAQLQEGARRGGADEYLALVAEQIATGQRGQLTVVDATRRLYEARQKQLEQEQAMQRRALEIQQQREMSERRIAMLQLQIQLGQAKLQELELRSQQALLGLRAERDAISGTVTGAGALPTTGGATQGGVANFLPFSRSPSINDGTDAWRDGGTRRHNGQDIGVDWNGDRTVAARMDGKVIDAYSRGFGTVGGAVVVRYSNGQEGTYGHVTPVAGLRPGMTVAAGQKIADVTPDRRGRGDNTHLHYELRDALGKVLNPLTAVLQSLAVKAGQMPAAQPSATATRTTGRGAPQGVPQLDATGAARLDRFLNYLAFIESGFNNGAQNASSGAIGRFQFTAPTLQDAREKYGIDPADLRSSDFARQKRAVAEFIRKDAIEAYRAITSGNTPLAEQLLLRRWPSLRGGDQAATGDRLATGLSYLNGAAPPIPGSIAAGAQSLTGRLLGAGQTPDSVTNEAERLTQGLTENTGVQEQLQTALTELTEWIKKLPDLFKDQSDTLNEQQQGDAASLRLEGVRARVEAALNADPQVRFARDQTNIITGGIGNLVRTGVMGLASGNTAGLKEALAGALADLGSRMLESTVNALLEPLLAQLSGVLVNAMAGPRIQEIAATQGLTAAGGTLQTAGVALTNAALMLSALSTAQGAGGALGGIAKVFGAIGGAFGGFGLPSLVPGAEALASTLPNFAGSLGAVQFNPLAFSSGFAGFFAGGGDIDWGMGAVVGERGPELAYSGRPSSIISADRTATILSRTRQALESSRSERQQSGMLAQLEEMPARPIPIESRVINQVEYVTREQAQQLAERAEMRGARRGQAMAFNEMQNNLRVRRRLGMG
jgi:hypothetical protein